MRKILSISVFLLCGINLCAQEEYKVLNITGSDKKVLGVDLETYAGAEITFVGDAMQVTVNNNSYTFNDTDELKLSYSVAPAILQRAISEVGYATYAPAMDVKPNANANVVVYKVSETDETSATIEKTVGVIPAGEGVLLGGESATYTFTQVLFPDNTPANFDDNLLIGVLEDTQVEPYTVYTLGSENTSGQIGFWQYTGASVAAGTAYLTLPSMAAAPRFLILYDPLDPTGLGGVVYENGSTISCYNLNGIKVDVNTKGIVITNNGQKIWNK